MNKGTALLLMVAVLGVGYGAGRLVTGSKGESKAAPSAKVQGGGNEPTGPGDGVDRVRVPLEGPAKGPANAPIELIEFSDFQCPFCLQANPTVTKVLDTYGDRIHFVYRHYPLPNHPNARPAAEAAECAAEQDKFWPYHDRLFASAGKLADSDLKQAAADLGLDSGRFSSCFEARKYTSIVDADIRAGNDAGVSATPAFFINGRLVSGAQPFDVFKGIIDEELERKKP